MISNLAEFNPSEYAKIMRTDAYSVWACVEGLVKKNKRLEKIHGS